ncbi:MAG: M23 family metallopeptidase [Sphingomonadales bacterium]|nr:MAG: M23 family metallopeptidase [Sphingomonadales bacterium]
MRISPIKQFTLATLLLGGLAAWAGTSISALIEHMRLDGERERLERHSMQIQAQDRNLRHNRRQLDERTRTLESRQRQLERIVQQYLGIEFSRGAVPKKSQLSSLAPIDRRLALIEQRQLGFATEVTRTTSAQRAEQGKTFRRLGLPSPGGREGRGGPFIPYDGPVPSLAMPSPEQLFAGLRYSLGEWQTSNGFMAALPAGHPVSRLILTSPFGVRADPFTRRRAAHLGQDFEGSMGDPVMAAGEGTVSHAGWRAGYGKVVVVDHGYHLQSLYAHLSRIAVQEGQRIQRGERVGLMGSTGRSTGSHLHFEVRLNGRSINPRPLMEANFVR